MQFEEFYKLIQHKEVKLRTHNNITYIETTKATIEIYISFYGITATHNGQEITSNQLREIINA